MDQGSALDVSGVADAAMRGRLIELLSSLPLRCTKKVWEEISLPAALSSCGEVILACEGNAIQPAG